VTPTGRQARPITRDRIANNEYIGVEAGCDHGNPTKNAAYRVSVALSWR
jgi:hypothetical protein